MQKIMPVIGTRPETIKLALVIKKLEGDPEEFKIIAVSTAQHREVDESITVFR